MKTATALVTTVIALGITVPGPAGAEPPDSGSAQRALDATSVRLGPVRDLPSGPGGSAQSRRLDTAPYTMVALTWRGAATPDVDVRTRSGRSWSRWHDLALLTEHGRDAGTGEAPTPSALSSTELLWAGRSDGVQVRVHGDAGRRTRVRLVDSRTLPTDGQTAPAPSPRDRVPDDAPDPTDAPQPDIRSRGEWGADESWRNGGPTYNGTIKQAHIHHTAGTNVYRRVDVPAIIRGDYWYHTQVLGWSDLGYNFVVDRFGRLWEGRAGGVDRPVRGAHTLGFNHASFGVAAIGDFEVAEPRPELVRALARLSAWKLDGYDREPAGRAWVTSQGSDRYPEGTRVRLPVIDGHRDTNETACPGENLYAELPEIRKRAQRRADGSALLAERPARTNPVASR
ncbi:MAG: N-acetylmuramoyl-L-alanine amidase [Actinomycetota bacterium]|nr:N-acetylmuramoyl-L-alanine amidase [Actinomycetota bacterium]